jgi:hypothetical protein
MINYTKLFNFQITSLSYKSSLLSNNSCSILPNYGLLNDSVYHLITSIHILIKVFGLFINFLSLIVLSNPIFVDNIFKFLFIHSIIELSYFTILIISEFDFNDDLYLTNLLELIFFKYLASCFSIFNIFIEITISLQRFLIVSNIKWLKIIKNGSPYLITTFIFIISIACYIPELVFSEINRLPSNKFTLNVSNEQSYKVYSIVITFFRGPFCIVLITVTNLLTLIRFKKFMKTKTMLHFPIRKGENYL